MQEAASFEKALGAYFPARTCFTLLHIATAITTTTTTTTTTTNNNNTFCPYFSP